MGIVSVTSWDLWLVTKSGQDGWNSYEHHVRLVSHQPRGQSLITLRVRSDE